MLKSKFLRILLLMALVVAAFGLMPNRTAHALTFTVTTIGDGGDTNLGDNACVATTGGCTLRAAIQQANASGGADTINFNMPSNTITPGSALPSITSQITIDGTTQPGYNANALSVRIVGTSAGVSNGLVVTTGGANSFIRALNIRQFGAHGIVIETTGVTLQNNFIGTNNTGTSAAGNTSYGVVISNNSNAIGGTTFDTRNVISGNGVDGILITGGSSNVIQNNFIGTNYDGNATIGNGGRGINITNGSNNFVRGNLIGGNALHGVEINGGGSNTIDTWNRIGVSVTGAQDLGNLTHGIYVLNSSNNQIGGANSGVRNAVSGNNGSGIVIEGGTSNAIRANFVGFDFNGLLELGNSANGIYLINTTNTAVGGSTSEGNFIGANGGNGVYITGGSANLVRGNFIGLDNGTSPAPNALDGVAVNNSPSTIIGNGEGYGNWIVYNSGSGISLVSSNSSIVQSNTVGAGGVNATSPAPNGQHGLYMNNSSFVTVGGVSGQDNVFAGNLGYGIYINGGQSVQLLNTEVGTNGPSQADVGNGLSGVRIDNGVAFLIDTFTSSGNGGHGLEINGGGGHTIRRNFFGVGNGGTLALPNGGDGIYIENSVNNLIGGPNPGEGNTISGNVRNGVTISGSGATGNIIQQSVIGLRLDLTAGLPNGGDGVAIVGGNNNQVGQSYTQFNWIAANGGSGVAVYSGSGNAIRSQIWSNGGLGIDLDADGIGPADGVSVNDPLDADTGGNNRTNYPILTNASNFFVNGTMRGAPNTTYTISLFNSPNCDAAGFGEGQSYFNSVNVTTNAAGTAPYQTTVPQVGASTVYTAIATGPNGTSEFSPCIRAYTTAIDSMSIFNPATRNISLLKAILDNPPGTNFITYGSGVPTGATNGQWIMGDWDGDGQKTPGVYGPNGVFYYVNSISGSAVWQGIWIGLYNRPVVAGRFDATRENDCVGAIDSGNFPPWGLAFAMYYTCNLVDGTAPAMTFQWLSILLPDSQGFTGTHQFVAGDYDGDGLDSIASRRGPFIAFSNTPPTTQNAIFPLAQYIGEYTTGGSNVVSGDWNGDLIDSFGLFYENGAFFFRNDLEWNTGAITGYYLGQPVGFPVTGSAWRPVQAGTGGAAGGEPGGEATGASVVVVSQTVESTDSRVTRDGVWSVQSTQQASGASYVYGSSDAVLTLEFSGTSAEVIYLAGPQMGSFTILVDDVAVRTIIARADQTAFDQRTVINYLEDGPHTLKIVAVDGRTAIDAFVVGIAQP